jgi:hypothetical protein
MQKQQIGSLLFSALLNWTVIELPHSNAVPYTCYSYSWKMF